MHQASSSETDYRWNDLVFWQKHKAEYDKGNRKRLPRNIKHIEVETRDEIEAWRINIYAVLHRVQRDHEYSYGQERDHEEETIRGQMQSRAGIHQKRISAFYWILTFPKIWTVLVQRVVLERISSGKASQHQRDAQQNRNTDDSEPAEDKVTERQRKVHQERSDDDYGPIHQKSQHNYSITIHASPRDAINPQCKSSVFQFAYTEYNRV